MSLEARLRRIEAARGDATGCACPNSMEVRYYPGEDSKADADRDERPAATCATCGGVRTLLKVVYEKDWRGAGV